MSRIDHLIYVVTVSVAAAASMSSPSGAQQRPRIQPDAPPRVAGIASTPPPVVVVHPPQPGVVTTHPAPAVHFVRPVAVGFLPAVVLADGRVFADFGRGYEPVVRSCAVAAPVVYGHIGTATPATVGGGSAVITAPRYEAPNYRQSGTSASTPPPATASITVGPAPAPAQIAVAGASCWTTNAMGHVTVVR